MVETLGTTTEAVLGNPWLRVVLILVLAVLVSVVLGLTLVPALRRLAARSGTRVDDDILHRLTPALFQTVFLEAVRWAVLDFVPDRAVDHIVHAVVSTLMIMIWGRVFLDVGSILFKQLSAQADRFQWIQPQTLPLIQFAYKVLAISVMAYVILSVWEVNLTSWLASAGVMGIAIGFAAKDTLANFISGIFILVDSPYKVGQYIIIEDTTRGMVTDIGMRSTRLLTRDNVEVTVPNAVIGNAKIVNESSGPTPKMRVRVPVSVAYGSDVEAVREVLMSCTGDLANTDSSQEATVRFNAMGASSLDFLVMVWITHPAMRGRVVDTLNTRIYKALNDAGIAIPFPQQDLYIKEWPGVPAGDRATPPAHD